MKFGLQLSINQFPYKDVVYDRLGLPTYAESDPLGGRSDLHRGDGKADDVVTGSMASKLRRALSYGLPEGLRHAGAGARC